MVGNWRERKESGVDTKEGAIKVSILKAVLFLWRGLKPPGHLITARKRSLRRLCFHRCLSVHRGGVSAPLHARIPRANTPLSTGGVSAPLQNPPVQNPPGQTHNPLGRHTTPWADTPLRSACWYTVNKRAVRIPLESILVLDLFLQKQAFS